MNILLWGSKEFPFGISTGDKYPSGGIEKTVDSLSRSFGPQGHKVFVITRKIKVKPDFDDSQLLKQNIIVKRVSWINGKFLRMPSYNLSVFFYLLFTKKNYDILYTHGIFANFLGLFISKLKGVNQYMSPSGVNYTQKQYGFFKFVLKLLEKYTYSRPARVVYSSVNEKELFETKLNIKTKNYLIISQGVNLNKVDPKKVQELTAKFKKPNLLYVGRLSKVKNIDLLIKVMKHISANLIIVGDGEEKENLVALTSKLGLQKKVFFEGYKIDVQNYLSFCDLFVLLSDSEGLSNSMLEAMSMGVPCVISKTIKLPFSKGCAIFVDQDELEIKSKINELLSDKAFYLKMSKNAEKEIEANYNWDKISCIYIHEFNKSLSNLKK